MNVNRSLVVLAITFIVVRLTTLGFVPLTDPSEARFANAGWYILQNQEWFRSRIFSQHNEWLLYMAKPPFYPMVLAGSFLVFGVNEFAARFPSFLAVLGSMALICFFCSRFFNSIRFRAPLLFFSLPSVFLFAVATITDPFLSFLISAATVFLFVGSLGDKDSGRYLVLGYVSMAGAVLIKGPIGAIFPVTSIGIVSLLDRDLAVVRRVLFLPGIAVFLGIVVPLYAAVEFHQPGFIRYFLIQENFGRYFLKDFGIRYGSTHRHLYGTIWVYFLGITLPWAFSFLRLFPTSSRKEFLLSIKQNRALRFLFVWMLTPLLFFTFARQILPTYVFPSIAPAMIIATLQFERWTDQKFFRLLVAALVPLTLIAFLSPRYLDESSSTKELSKHLLSGKVSCDSIVSYLKIPQSLNFYLRNSRISLSVAQSGDDIARNRSLCIVTSEKKAGELLNEQELASSAVKRFGKTLLIQRKGLTPESALSIAP